MKRRLMRSRISLTAVSGYWTRRQLPFGRLTWSHDYTGIIVWLTVRGSWRILDPHGKHSLPDQDYPSRFAAQQFIDAMVELTDHAPSGATS